MDDLISRRMAIETIVNTPSQVQNKQIPLTNQYDGATFRQIEILGILDTLPPAQQWIPVTERLPERGVSVLISHVGYVSEDYLDIDNGSMYFWNSGIEVYEELKNLAWMPLPEPWKGENKVK